MSLVLDKLIIALDEKSGDQTLSWGGLSVPNVNLVVVLQQKSKDHKSHLDSSSGNHEGSKLYTNPSSRWWDISQDKWKLWPAGGTTGKFWASPKSAGFIAMTPEDHVYKMHKNSSNWDISFWSKEMDQPTHQHCHLSSHAACLTFCWLLPNKTLKCLRQIGKYFLKLCSVFPFEPFLQSTSPLQ